MDALVFKVSDAGRAALVNAQNNGTDPVLVAAVGVTDQAFVAAADTAVLPGERKRLTTFSGAAVAADTIHVTIRDDTADVYTVRGFALYLDDGTLFGSYGQADPIGEKSAQSMFLLANDIIFADIDATQLTFGDTNFLLASATTEQQGILELATDAETTTGTDATRGVVPKGLKAALDARFGVGAPSGFVKGLLTAATAALFRTALAIKGAALYDTGTGNGLDADLLDGQHGAYYRAWANLTGVPASFPPSAHTHAWVDITGAPAYATRWATWDEVTGKPATFPPAPHSQDWSTILNIPATASRWPAWSEVTGKPTVEAQLGFTPVQQGTGVGQLGNAVKIGWSPLGLKCTVDVSDQGLFAFQGWVTSNFATAAQGAKADSAVQPNTTPTLTGVNLSGSVEAQANFTANGYRTYRVTASDSGKWGVYDATAGAWLFTINPDNSAVFGNTVTATGYNTAASSRTVKHDIAPCRYGLAEFLQIPWVEYRYDKCITDDDRLRFGSIVEDVEPVAPELVIKRQGQVSTFEYDQFIPVIGRALQQYIALANDRADKAEARADGLARTLAELTDRLAQLERTVAQPRPQGMPSL